MVNSPGLSVVFSSRSRPVKIEELSGVCRKIIMISPMTVSLLNVMKKF